MVLLLLEFGREVSRIALVSPERSRQIESILLRMAQSGQLRGRVSEHSSNMLCYVTGCWHRANQSLTGERSAIDRALGTGERAMCYMDFISPTTWSHVHHSKMEGQGSKTASKKTTIVVCFYVLC